MKRIVGLRLWLLQVSNFLYETCTFIDIKQGILKMFVFLFPSDEILLYIVVM